MGVMHFKAWVISTSIISAVCLFISLNNQLELICWAKSFFEKDMYIFEFLKVASFGGLAMIINTAFRTKAEDQLVMQIKESAEKKEHKFTSSILNHFFIRNPKTWVKASLYGEWKGMYDRLPENDLKYKQVFYLNEEGVAKKDFYERLIGSFCESEYTTLPPYYVADTPCEYIISRYSKTYYSFPPLDNKWFSKEKYDEIYKSENKIQNIFHLFIGGNR